MKTLKVNKDKNLVKINKKDSKNKNASPLKKPKNKPKRKLKYKTKNKKKLKFLIQLNIMKTDPKWSMTSKNHHKHILILINSTLNFPLANSLLNTKQPLSKENSLKNKHQLLAESPTSEPKEKILSFMI